MRISKFEAATNQLNTAVRLFFSESDPISTETLAAAAIGILKGIAKPLGIRAPLHDNHCFRNEYLKEWIKHLHEYQGLGGLGVTPHEENFVALG